MGRWASGRLDGHGRADWVGRRAGRRLDGLGRADWWAGWWAGERWRQPKDGGHAGNRMEGRDYRLEYMCESRC